MSQENFSDDLQYSQVAHSNYTLHKHGSLPISISIMVVRVSLVELGNLNNLLELHLSSNKLIGTIPSNIRKLKKLVLLDLEYNMLIGPIPFSLGYLTSLTYLSLGSNLINALSGSIPSSLGGLINLGVLNIHSNKIDGTINSKIRYCILLEQLDLSNNNLYGIIPFELTLLTHL
ncbi:lrr receptor-like serine/threonine-protein kinase erl1 [Quercus suber]|uniref:Lrr receptor-like serine/threonine-protein kinase erl1 n=1 Tax=Quercus suber TaxID=58331 RepID=A0AAW0IUU2_QUESU